MIATSTPIISVDNACRSARWPAVAGFAYVAAWLVGLTAFGAGPGADATGAEVAEYFAARRLSTAAQSVLIHGVAAVALLAILVAVARRKASTRPAHLAGIVGVGVSLLQLVLDLWRSLLAAGSTTTALVDAIDRADGLKMLAFSIMIGASIRSLRSVGMTGRRMAVLSVVAASSLVVSGIAYGGSIDALLPSALLSLPLLLVWAGHLGFAAARRPI
ncbi:MAG TPA: hypothetical protein VEA78_12315 [Acidimicrobiales bacterium]|nr:hypothetical protein [Acidimicrobiales bacterium]